MKNIILWGTGVYAQKIFEVIEDTIVMVVDNDCDKWGTSWNGFVVEPPRKIELMIHKVDKIVIAAARWKEIRKQIIDEFNVDIHKVDNMFYRQREMLLAQSETNREEDKKVYYDYLKDNLLEVFNETFSDKYEDMDVNVFYDEENAMYYVYHCGKKMFFSKDYKNERQVRNYYRCLLREQDVNSPHRYLKNGFHVLKGDIVLDAGVAEGNFALEIIDLVEKIYLIEADSKWVEALKCTFAPYMEKVCIVEKFLGDEKDEITVDEIIGNGRLDFIKMDIEGAEVRALKKAEATLKNNEIKLVVCAYHNPDDEEDIKNVLEEYGYCSEPSQGYMVFITDDFWQKEVQCPTLVHGLIRGRQK